jgi:hypothetical protein
MAWINGVMEESLSQVIDAAEIITSLQEPALFPDQDSNNAIDIPQPNPPQGLEPGQFGFDTTRDSLIERFGEPDLDEIPDSYEGTSVEWMYFAKAGVIATIFNSKVVGVMTIDPVDDWQGVSILNASTNETNRTNREDDSFDPDNAVEVTVEDKPIDRGEPVEVIIDDSGR